MKKYLFLLVTLIMMGLGTAHAQKVFVTDNGTVYHKQKSCSTLKKAKTVKMMPINEVKKKKGIRPCKVCFADQKAKKPAAAKKAPEKKAAKKALPARDEKGRFIKKK